MPKLHELLAVEGDVRGEYNRVTEEAKVTFNKKANLFSGSHRSLTMFDESRKQEESAATQHQELEETVPGKLSYLSDAIIRRIDHLLQKESSNQSAHGELESLEVGNLPATFLLTLEQILKEVRLVFESIPNLPPGVRWEPAPDKGSFVYRAANDEESLKTEKQLRWKEISPATKEHKAQVETWKDDIPVGKYKTERLCGMISSAQKSKLLARTDALMQEVKRARQRANTVEASTRSIGKEIMGYLLGELKE